MKENRTFALMRADKAGIEEKTGIEAVYDYLERKFTPAKSKQKKTKQEAEEKRLAEEASKRITEDEGSEHGHKDEEGINYLGKSVRELRRLYLDKKEAYSHVMRKKREKEEEEARRNDLARRCARLDFLLKRDFKKVKVIETDKGEKEKKENDGQIDADAVIRGKDAEEEAHKVLLNESLLYRFLCCFRCFWWKSGWIRRLIIRGCCCHLKFYKNGILLFIVGEGLASEDVSEGINALALVNALFLTLPFGLIAAMTPDYLSGLKTALDACPNSETTTGIGYTAASKSLRRACEATIISALSALILSIIYYLFKRNEDRNFREWWPKGRILVFVCSILSIATVVSTVSLMNNFFFYFTVRTSSSDGTMISDEVCNRYYDMRMTEYAPTILVPIASLVSSVILMM
jgi:hypothetical protein